MTPQERHAVMVAVIDESRQGQGWVSVLCRALRAVLDLHKPRKNPLLGAAVCDQCLARDGGIQEYPCPTVAAIERALKGEGNV